MATSTDQLPWVGGQWQLAESEIAWLQATELNGTPMLHLRLSVACWRADASLAWRYWPGIDVHFRLDAPLTADLRGRLGDMLGRVTGGDVQEAHVAHVAPLQHVLTLGTPPSPQPSLWAVHLLNGETIRWQALGWQAWCDAGRVPQEWLHC